MPKIKTKRSAAKRFKKTGGGKFVFRKSGHSHILTTKSTKKKRNQRRAGIISESDMKQVKRMLPYGG